MSYTHEALQLILESQINTVKRDTELKGLLINLTHEVEELRKEVKKNEDK